MKKVLVIALMLGAGLAFASSIGIPWFSDGAATGAHPPQASGGKGAEQFIMLKNMDTADITCTIAYYNQDGLYQGPDAPANSFIIPLGATVAFRPVQDDTFTESAIARTIPNRPRTTLFPGNANTDTKKNGSAVVSWTGTPDLVIGISWLCQIGATVQSSIDSTEQYVYMGYGAALPSGS